ncbi:MAG: hypothetical protein FWF78_00320 [Defluviitaleaceae bacterium]|nr:hypothetical protein [Defluviitaleaceae bacterium]
MEENNMYQPPTPPSDSAHQSDTAVMSTKDWAITLAIITLIPCVGIIMAFVWAFGNTGNLNRRNYCRAYLIIMAITVAVVFLFYVMIFAVMGAALMAW